MPDYTIKIRRQNRRSLMMRPVPGGFEVFIPRWMKKNSPQVRAFIEEGMAKIGDAPPVPPERTSREQILGMVETWAARIGVQPGRVTLREMERKWGSCSSRTNVTLNSRLCWLPPQLAEYVVVHELVHLREFNHGKGFKALMTQHLPDWREREEALKNVRFR
jgi:predicted metal-dependent hydrolase